QHGNIHITIPPGPQADGITNPPVTDPVIDVGIVVNLTSGPSITVSYAPNAPGNTLPAGNFNWEVGQAQTNGTNGVGTPETMNTRLICNDTRKVTWSQPWLVAGAQQPNSSASAQTVAVSINTAVAPTTPGTYTGTLTVSGTQGESPAVQTYTLNVAGPVKLTV